MDDFEFIEDCCRLWMALPEEKRLREQQWVIDVVQTIEVIENTGLLGFWKAHATEADRIIESFRVTGNPEIATALEESRFCRPLATENGPIAMPPSLSLAQRTELTRLLFRITDLIEAARESLVQLLPADSPTLENGEDPDPAQPTVNLEVTERIQCPYCGQSMDLVVDTSVGQQRSTTDCEVCCRPFEMVIECEPGEVIGVEIET